MNIRIITVGKLKEVYLKDAINEYSKRISKYASLTIEELQEEKITIENDSYCEISKSKEGERILSRLTNKDFVCLLDLRGQSIDSISFAEKLDNWSSLGKNIVFIIGGSYGVSDEVYSRADYKLAFSKLTFPHQLFRVMLLEQIYRGFKINHNEKYHK